MADVNKIKAQYTHQLTDPISGNVTIGCRTFEWVTNFAVIGSLRNTKQLVRILTLALKRFFDKFNRHIIFQAVKTISNQWSLPAFF
jgi:hypothetical protein